MPVHQIFIAFFELQSFQIPYISQNKYFFNSQCHDTADT